MDDDYLNDPEFVFEMDGSPHFLKESGCCCTTETKKCECGGSMHYQPVWGGYYRKCEVCGKED
jgi:hypothetical protein